MRTPGQVGEPPGQEESLRGRSLLLPVTPKCETGPGKGKSGLIRKFEKKRTCNSEETSDFV